MQACIRNANSKSSSLPAMSHHTLVSIRGCCCTSGQAHQTQLRRDVYSACMLLTVFALQSKDANHTRDASLYSQCELKVKLVASYVSSYTCKNTCVLLHTTSKSSKTTVGCVQ